MTTTETRTRLSRPAPDGWKPGLTRVVHTDGEHGTYVGPSLPMQDVKPRAWLGVLVRFDGSPDHVDVDPADLTVTHLRDPFAAIAGRLPTRYAPGDTPQPYYFPAEDNWHPVIYYSAGEVVKGEGPIWLVEPFPAARADGSDGLDPVDGAGVAVLCGAAGPRPRTADRDGDWIIPGSAVAEQSAYDVWVSNRRDLLAAWCEAWAIAAALNSRVHRGLGVAPQDIEVLLAAERRALIGDSRYAKNGKALQWTPISDEGSEPQLVFDQQAARLRDSGKPLIEACKVVNKSAGPLAALRDQPVCRHQVINCSRCDDVAALSGSAQPQDTGWQETIYQLTSAGAKALHLIREAGATLGGPRCRVCGCTYDRACPEGCGWQRDATDGPLCTACPTTR